jgi:hypothetical protein
MFQIHRYTSKKACPGPDSRSQIFLAKDQVKATRDGLTWLKKDVALENPPSFGGKIWKNIIYTNRYKGDFLATFKINHD